MNYFDYLIGLGAGIVISMTIRLITDARNEKREALEEKEKKHDKDHAGFEWHKKYVETNFRIIIDRIDQHAGRIEKLESKKR